MTFRLLAPVVLAASLAFSVGGVDLAAYRATAAAGRVAVVEGRAYVERRTPSEADRPLPGVAVVLLPRSQELLDRLERIKAGARASQRAFREAASAMRREREAFEERVWSAGFPELAVATASDEDGRFTVKDLPAGDWLLIATRSVFVDRSGPRVSPRDRSIFAPQLRLLGYYAVSVWLSELSIDAGRPRRVELMDRNVWFTGVVEDRSPDSEP